MKGQQQPGDFKVYLTRRTFDPIEEPPVPPSAKPEYYIVQFKKSLTLEERDRLREKFGLSLARYVPNFAFLERLDFRTLTEISKDPLYRASALYQSEDKISPAIGVSTNHSAEPDHSVGLLTRVILFSEVHGEDVAKTVHAIESLSEPAVKKYPTNVLVDLDPTDLRVLDDRQLGGQLQVVFSLPSIDLLPLIAKLDEVQWIEEVVEAEPDNAVTVVGHCPGPNKIAGTIQSGDPASTPIWNQQINGTGQIIGLIDHTLLDLFHCMFKDRAGVRISASHRKVVGYRYSYSRSEKKHGTKAAAIALGDELGLAGLNANRGIAWGAKLTYDDLKIIGRRKSMLAVLHDASADQASIHSNSWHDDTREYNQTAADVDTFTWSREEHFVCGSAGNSGSNEVLGPPGSAKNALCVAASQAHPNHLRHGDGVSGPTRDDRHKPEICAPGEEIIAADSGSGCGCIRITDCATSFATPAIAGAAALVRQYYLEGFHRTGTRDTRSSLFPSGALIKATLLNSTVPMINELNDYPDNSTGWGSVKLDNTLFFAAARRKLFVADVRHADGLSSGQSHTHQITVTRAAEPLKITLVWSDPPSTLSAAARTLVNNLNLVVTSPDGYSTYLGNVNLAGGFSQPAPLSTTRDDRNNVEMVIVESPAEGVWIIRVEGAAVNINRQGYALVARGSLS